MSQDLRQVGGYNIEGMIGSGATSLVYRATKGGVKYALKLMRPDRPAGDKKTFRAEAAALARIAHPTVLQIVEAGEQDGRPYLVSPFIEGESLAERIQRGPLAPPDLVALACDLGTALDEVHKVGLIHRDVKPENVLLEAGRPARLIDLGLVKRADGELAQGEWAGTPTYAAPEQAGLLQRPVDARSDLYSLGIVLFEAATGQRPFSGNTAAEIFQQHASTRLPDVLALAPKLDAILARIVEKLAAKDPDDRYQSAASLLADLRDLAALTAAQGGGKPIELGSHRSTQRAGEVELVGRTEEIAALAAVWQRAQRGEGGAAVVEGEGGLGKTRLVRATIEGASLSGERVLWGKCQQFERVPLSAFRTAIDGLLAQIAPLPDSERAGAHAQLTAAAGNHAGLLKRLTPGLRALWAHVPDPPPVDGESEQARFWDAVMALVVNLADANKGLILVVDDIQWADDATVALFSRLRGAVAQHPLLMLATARNDAASRPALEHFVHAVGPAKLTRVPLAPLGSAACDQLITKHLGGRRLDERISARILSRSGGNPFVIGEYVRAVLEQGVLTLSSRGWWFDGDSLDTVVLPEDVHRVIVQRVQELSSATRAALIRAAVLGFSFRTSDLQQLPTMTLAAVEQALCHCVADNLIEESTAGYSFAHDRVHEAVMSMLTPAEALSVHQDCADLIERNGVRDDDDALRLATHLAHAPSQGQQERVFKTAKRAGDILLSRGTHDDAVVALERAFACLPAVKVTEQTRFELDLAYGSALSEGAHFKRADEAFRKALTHTDDIFDKAHVYALMGRNQMHLGDYAAAWEAVCAALAILGAPYPRSRVGELLTIGWRLTTGLIRLKTGLGYGSARGDERRRREAIAAVFDEGLRLTYFMGDVLRMVACCFLALHNVQFLGASTMTARAYGVFGAFMGVFGLAGPARSFGRRAVALADQLGDPVCIAGVAHYASYGVDCATDDAGVLGDMLRLVPSLERGGTYYDISSHDCHIISRLGRQGKFREMVEFLEAPLTGSDQSRYQFFMTSADTGVRTATICIAANADLHLGRTAEAQAKIASLDELVPDWRTHRFCRFGFLGYDIEWKLITGKPEDALTAFDKLGKEAFNDYYSQYFFINAAYAAYELVRTASGPERAAAWKRFLGILRIVQFGRLPDGVGRAVSPNHRHHLAVLRAIAAREGGNPRRAHALLDAVAAGIATNENLSAKFCVLRERARLAKPGDGDALKAVLAELVGLCSAQGWVRRRRAINEEFPEAIELSAAPEALGSQQSRSMSGSRSTLTGELRREGAFETLLSVSLEAVRSLDPKQQATFALDALIKTLGAERAFLFLTDENTGDLVREGARGLGNVDLPATAGCSMTIVNAAAMERRPQVVTGSDTGVLMQSASAVAQDLRSIIAVPMLVQEKLVGVFYLDSALAKGLFAASDTSLLSAVANQVAIAVESARNAQRELRQKALERDLELTATVQSMFLPRELKLNFRGVELAAVYRSADQSGGDWWWAEELGDGSLLALVGDVTGHGVASAMVAGLVTGIQREHLRAHKGAGVDVPRMMNAVHEHLLSMTNGQFSMTQTALLISPDRTELRAFFAGGLPVVVADGTQVHAVQGASGPLGAAHGDRIIAEERVAIGPNTSLLLLTDGIVEQQNDKERDFGLRRVLKLLESADKDTAQQTASRIEKALDDYRGTVARVDDWTFVAINVRTPHDQASKQ